MSISVDLSGSWKLDDTQNLEPFLKKCGVNYVRRNLAKAVSPSVKIQQDGDKFIIITETVHRTMKLEFVIGDEFESTLPWEQNPRLMLATWDGDILVITMVDGKDRPVFRRYMEENRLVLEQELGGVKCKRYFKKTDQ